MILLGCNQKRTDYYNYLGVGPLLDEADLIAEKGNYQEALTKYHLITENTRGLNLRNPDDQKAALTAALVEAQIYLNVYNDYGNALKALKQGEKIATKYNLKKDGLNFLYGTVYFTFASQNNVDEYFDKGANYFLKVLENTDSVDNDLMSYAVNNLILYSEYGNVYAMSKKSVEDYLNSPVSKTEIKNYEFNLALDSLMNFLRIEQYAEASQITERLRKDHTLPMKRVIPGMYFISGKIAEKAGNLDEAKEYMVQAESMIDPENGLDMMLEIYESLEKIYSLLNDFTNAKEYADKSRALRKELTSFAQLSSVNNIEIEEEVNLIKENYAHEAQKSENLKRWIVLIAIFSLIALLFLGVLLYFFRKLRENNKMLYKRYLDLLQLNKEKETRDEVSEPAEIKNPDVMPSHDSEIVSEEEDDFEEEIKKIEETLENSEEIYSSEFTSTTLSVLTGIKPHLLSSIISNHYKTNFRNLINSRRVRAVCYRLETSTVYDNVTIDAIGEDVGIKSRTTFTSAFKAETGMTPGKYIQFARKRKEEYHS